MQQISLALATLSCHSHGPHTVQPVSSYFPVHKCQNIIQKIGGLVGPG